MLRDQEKDEAYFKYALEDKINHIEKINEYLRSNTGVPVRLYEGLYSDYLSILLIEYSAGKNIDELAKYVPLIFENFLKKIALEVGNDDYKYEQLNTYIGIYEDVLTTLCIGILFNVDKEMLDQFKMQCDSIRGKDLLLESIWSIYKKTEIPQTQKKLKLLYPKSYTLPYQILQKDTTNKEDLLLEYCTNWMKTKKSASWYGNLKLSKTGGVCSYEGYWNLEGAVIAHLLNIQPSKFEGIKYFPFDMVFI